MIDNYDGIEFTKEINSRAVSSYDEFSGEPTGQPTLNPDDAQNDGASLLTGLLMFFGIIVGPMIIGCLCSPCLAISAGKADSGERESLLSDDSSFAKVNLMLP